MGYTSILVSLLTSDLLPTINVFLKDVLELNADPASQGISSQLIVDGKYEYSDLDELLVNHVKAMSRRVEDLMGHDKFKKDDDELRKHQSIKF